ncbi:MAG: 4-hydroxy-3-methylbut-2-enyl diphosphate reductase [Lachnospiraceae bacterium]|nr:4-hydroxy-3-methylbut-2-enyl diphosphate reductase [Lachnospiraceae bacterium]
MEVILAKNAGFCFGVERAIDQVYEQIKTGEQIYTFGPIVHNETVIRDLEERGVRVIADEDELKEVSGGIMIIRAHGVAKRIYELLEQNGIAAVDATCPFVKKIHRTVEKESANGKQIIIIGSEDHPEVQGIIGWCENGATVIRTPEEAKAYKAEDGAQICLVSQTTFNHNKFQELVEIISKKGYDINVANTICNATQERQEETARLAEQVDAMIVIGGMHSSNTRKLYDICKERCEHTFFVQTADDLNSEVLKGFSKIGITAGASTPNKLIEEVQNNVRFNF